MYPLARSRSRSLYSAISLVIESEREHTGADADAHVDTLLKAANPFMCMRNRCIAYAVCIYVTFSTLNGLNMFAAVQ